MTTHIKALIVILDGDPREDDVQPLIEAIRQLRGVLDVTTHAGGVDAQWAKENAKNELIRKLWEVLHSP